MQSEPRRPILAGSLTVHEEQSSADLAETIVIERPFVLPSELNLDDPLVNAIDGTSLP